MRLVEALVYARMLAQVFIVFTVVIIIGLFAYRALKPVPPLAVVFNPDYGCGPLPELKFTPVDGVSYADAEVQINTKKEALQFMPPIAYVYRIRYKGETFALRERLFNLAEQMDFDPNKYEKPEPYIFKWEDGRRVFVANSKTGAFLFSLKSSVLPVLKIGRITFADDAQRAAERVVSRLSLLQGYLEYKTGKPSYWVYSYPKKRFVKVDSGAEASAVRVDFFSRKPLLIYDLRYFSEKYRQKLDITRINYISFYKNRDKLLSQKYTREYVARTVGPKPNVGNPAVYVHSAEGRVFRDQIIKLEYLNWDILDVPCGTYPLRDIAAVTGLVVDKRAILVYVAPFGADETATPRDLAIKRITVNDIELAYYMGPGGGEFLQPIYLVKAAGYDSLNRRYDMVFYVDGVLRKQQ